MEVIEKTLKDYLETKIENVPVLTELKPGYDKYVLIERSGHYVEDYVHHATIHIRSVAESLYKAALLDEDVQKAMEDACTENIVSACNLEDNYNDTDGTINVYRYRSIFLITW